MNSLFFYFLLLCSIISSIKCQSRPTAPNSVNLNERGTHLILASKIVRPSSVYRCMVSILYVDHPVNVRASMQRDGVEIASGKADIIKGSPEPILLNVPKTVADGKYVLRVEGNVPGSTGGTIFLNETELYFSTRFLTVLMQTSRPVYTGDQHVRFRIILLTTELKPYDDPVDVYILDPDGYAMRRWPSRPTNVGVISMSFKLPFLPKSGWWKLRAVVNGQVEEKIFRVEKWYTPRFEFKGLHYFNFSMYEVSRRFAKLDGAEVRVEAEVMDTFLSLNHTGFSYSKIINSSVNCRFIGSPPFVFKPGMPFYGTVAVSYHDLQPLSREKLERSRLVIRADSVTASGKRIPNIVVPHLSEEREINKQLEKALDERKRLNYYKIYYGKDYYQYTTEPPYSSSNSLNFNYMDEDQLVAARIELLLNRSQYEDYRSKGFYQFKIDVPDDTSALTLSVTYADDEGDTAGAQVELLPFYSEKVMAKNMILYASRENIDSSSQASVKTISIPVSSEMAPSFTIVVYYMTQENEIISDSLTVPVDSISRHKVRLHINMDKDHTLNTVEMGTYSSAGSFFGISGTRNYTYAMQGGNELSHSSVLETLHSFTNQTRPIHKMVWRSREGFSAEKTAYFITNNYGPDPNRTFLFNNLVVFTDAHIGVLPGYKNNYCNESDGYSYCLIAGCYLTRNKCNGIRNCADGFDEVGCENELEDVMHDFRINQFSRFFELYDARDGDWTWIDTNIGHKGYEVNTIPLPRVDDSYIVNAFSMSPTYGFGLIEAPQEFLSLPPIYMKAEMPDSCRRGETVGLRTVIFNTTPREHMIMVIVHGSDYHRIVKVEAKGIVEYYKPRTEAGDHQHLLTVDPFSATDVVFPIAPLPDHGNITIRVSTISQIGRDERNLSLRIEPEGATINRHTSILFDLKNRALAYEYLDIILDESYQIPLKILRRFVAGSTVGHVSLCGDVVGPSFPNGGPVDTVQMVRKILRGTEASMFNFGANLWTLHYLRLTNQLDYSKHFPIFEHLNVELAAIMYRFDRDGSFRMWDTAEPSVWLTALTTRTVHQAQFQDWENLIYIEPYIVSKAVSWLLKYQTDEGSFMEYGNYQKIPLSHTIYSMPTKFGNTRPLNISLTAHVLITLQQTVDSLQGDTRTKVNGARYGAVRFLERHLHQIKDPYELAVVAYALSVSNSGEKEVAYSLLNKIKREENGLIYWSRKKIETNKRIRENNQRSLLQPKFEEEYDAHAIEATSYALLVYLIREGVTFDQNRIVDWLNAMRLHDGGFTSTVDTLIALQALTEYSYRARLRDITDMRIEIEISGEAGEGRKPHEVRIANSSVSEMSVINIDKVWGLVSVIGRGAGQAILQLDVGYGVDWYGVRKRPPVNAFDMTVRERWINLKERNNSAAAVIEIENPTGYVVYQLDAEKTIKIAQKSSFPSIRDVIGGHSDFYQTKTVWFFDYIPGNESWCFEYKIRRWYPVANMTRVRMATIYEQYQPERFQMVMFNSTTNSLDVCEVCASYQCPYCPIYSFAMKNSEISWLLVISSFVIIFCNYTKDKRFSIYWLSF
ncbi:Antigen [Armadillidium nasatum]|uniref:Antigen n=1 Tax=Armadillidium nasatum TaxID=96803 RepID=A0A5N5T7C6_9CRUS|nr:Antigen [Armadillidium nasatum]